MVDRGPNVGRPMAPTKEMANALAHCAQALENRQGWRWDAAKTVCLAIAAGKFQPLAVLFQWFVNDKDPFHALEWLLLPHTATKTAWTVNDMFSHCKRQGATANPQGPGSTCYLCTCE